MLRGEVTVLGLREAERVGLAPAVDLAPPGLEVRLAVRLLLAGELGQQVGDDLLEVADDRHVRRTVLADLRRVDVRVDDRRVRGEARELAGHAVVEAGAEREDQVGLLQRGHGRDRAVHAGHAEVLRVRVGQRAAGHERRDCSGAGEVDELAQLGRRAGTDRAAADVEDGPTRRGEQAGGLTDLLAVRLRHRVVARAG